VHAQAVQVQTNEGVDDIKEKLPDGQSLAVIPKGPEFLQSKADNK
jgi:hypothetical protein